MSKVFNMVGGGGKNISSIIITGPESTDTITCTKDEKTYPAIWDSTAQHWEIVGLPLGTFTVTATNETKTITETVLIDIAGVYEIEMVMKIWLYNGDDSGNEFIDVTGGWGITGYSQSGWSIAAMVKEDSCLNTTCVNKKIMCLGTANAIDLTQYTKIYVDSYQNEAGTFAMFMTTSKTNYYSNNAKSLSPSSENRIISSVDISALTGSYYLVLHNGSQNEGRIGKVYKIWLE